MPGDRPVRPGRAFRGGEPHKVRKADRSDFRDLGLPIVVLLNEHSASGSEVLAAALRDRGVAVIAGARSFGKGVYQQVQRYEDGQFVIKFTAGYYVTPAGRIIEGHLNSDFTGGIEPDLPVGPASPSESRAIYIALQQDEIPEPYRELAISIWQSLTDYPMHPVDPATELALKALQASLSPVG